VNYKAVDSDLRCTVALKVLGSGFLGDESASKRFMREARAAASVRHPNVASVFHLGKDGNGFFYAMEYVEGETLEQLVKQDGCLTINLALEITSQIAAGLMAIHRQNLVHRDIKPSNIMVRLNERDRPTVKIIDLGLAKSVGNVSGEDGISTPGAFAGTPEFASPEQFSGVPIDIRSDLYSLGVVLWRMVTGHAVFKGTPAELMYQHQHTPLPVDRLRDVPQPVATLLYRLLEKDPTLRFQDPGQVLIAVQEVAGGRYSGRKISPRDWTHVASPRKRAKFDESPNKKGPKKISISRLPVTGNEVFGRKEDIAFWIEPGLTRRSILLLSLRGLVSGSRL
jgi:serine/threonine protein kinase